MQDYYLKTENIEELWEALVAADLVETYTDDNGHVRFNPKGVALDIIGEIFKPTGEMIDNGDGAPVPEQRPVPGFHANLRGILTEQQQAILPLIPAPATPYQVWL